MAKLSIDTTHGIKFECEGEESFVDAQFKRFHTGLELDDVPQMPCSRFGYTVHASDWTFVLEQIKSGTYVPKVYDTVSCKLLDGREVDFVVTDTDDEYVRYESRDCLGEKMKHTDIGEYLNTVMAVIPPELKAAVCPTERKWLNSDGELVSEKMLLFVPFCSEVFAGDDYIGDEDVYEQLDYYKDRRNRIRFLSKNNDDYCYWWTLSAASGSNTYFVCVTSNGGVTNADASTVSIGAPVCFRIRKG